MEKIDVNIKMASDFMIPKTDTKNMTKTAICMAEKCSYCED